MLGFFKVVAAGVDLINGALLVVVFSVNEGSSLSDAPPGSGVSSSSTFGVELFLSEKSFSRALFVRCSSSSNF